MAVVAVVGSNSLTLGPIASDISSDLETSVTSVLAASAWFGFGTAASALLLARYIDRVGARVILSFATIVMTLSFAACALAPTTTMLCIAQLFAGLAAGVALPACYTSAAIIAPANQESRILGRVLTGWTISLVFGVSISALISDLLHWRVVFIVLCVFSGLSLIAVQRGTLPNAKTQGIATNPISALRVKRVPYLLFVVACYMTAFYGVYNYVGDHIVQSLHKPVRANAWIAISYGIGFGLATFLDPLLDRLTQGTPKPSVNRLTNVALAALALVYLLMSVVSKSYVLLVVVAGAWGVLNHLGLNILIAALNATDPNQRGAILGLYSCITYLCLGVGTIAFGFIYSASSFIVLCVCSVLLCAAAASAGWLRKAVKVTTE